MDKIVIVVAIVAMLFCIPLLVIWIAQRNKRPRAQDIPAPEAAAASPPQHLPFDGGLELDSPELLALMAAKQKQAQEEVSLDEEPGLDSHQEYALTQKGESRVPPEDSLSDFCLDDDVDFPLGKKGNNDETKDSH